METTDSNKTKGFLKSKLAKTFHRMTTKRSRQPVQCVSNYKVTPMPTSIPPSAQNGSVIYGLTQHQEFPNIISPMQKVTTIANSYKKTTNNSTHHCDSISNGSFDYGGGDENVDLKASNYISYVQGRFKQERIDANGDAF